MKLTVRLLNHGETLFEGAFDEAIEFGRQKQSELYEPRIQRSPEGNLRFLVAPLNNTAFPRQLLSVTPQESPIPAIVVINMRSDRRFMIDGIGPLAPLATQTVPLPTGLSLPDGYRLEFKVQATFTSKSYLSSAHRMAEPFLRNQTITQLPSLLAKQEGLNPSIILGWLNEVIKAMQRPASDMNYFKGFAQAVTQIADFDRAEVVLWKDGSWEHDESRLFIREELQNSTTFNPPSRSILEKARIDQLIVIHPDVNHADSGWALNSIQLLNAAIACPLLDEKKEVLGVLYADRGSRPGFSATEISDAEQRLIEILVAGITSGVLKSKQEQLVTKYQQFFSPKITEAIRQKPSLLAGEETNVTVLFCDIRGFSRIADKIGSARAMEWVSDTLSDLSEIVLESDGVLVDYVGDELFAMWGAPENSEIHAFQAAIAAGMMMNRRSVLSERWKEVIPEGVDFGIGLCTGPARVGNTGSKQKFKYGPMGTTVNLGSRIQGLTKQWKVGTLLDEATHGNLPSDMLRRRLFTANVVGLDGAIDLYELMPDDNQASKDLVASYEAAYSIFEMGNQPREAAHAFGELARRFPEDGPSLMMLVRSVNQLVEPACPFSPVWSAKIK
ncbi:MAG: adenylate/guanylate cyclase domain-containing protein [Planctomycetota bacterium]|nr:adenylate/guanylate cyclase domain-containing protein [Planctomycetota bacterium]